MHTPLLQCGPFWARRISSMALGMFVVVSILAGPARADTSVADVTAQAQDAWKQYGEDAGRLQGDVADFAVVDSSGKLQRGLSRTFRQSGAERSSNTTKGLGPERKGEAASVQNESYSFALTRNSHDAPWVITDFYERNHDASPGDFEDKLRGRHVGQLACAGLQLYNRPLFELLNDPEFVIESTEPRSDGLVRLYFTYSGKRPNFPIKQGWVDLDSKHFFVIHECEAQAKWADGAGTIHYSFTYDIEPDSFPRITRSSLIESVRDGTGASWNNEYVTEFDLSRTAPVSKSDFTLSAFGLPEPPGPSRSFLPTSLFFWTTALLLVGLLSLMAAARLNRR